MGNTAGMPADSPRNSPVELRNEDSGVSGSNENSEPDQSEFNSSPRRTNRRATRNASQCKQTTFNFVGNHRPFCYAITVTVAVARYLCTVLVN